MNTDTAILLMLLISVVGLLLFFFSVVAVRSDYRNGVRDGYQNTWLPHVKRQVKEEQLMQGDRVRFDGEEQ